jgi:hypothetical protein
MNIIYYLRFREPVIKTTEMELEDAFYNLSRNFELSFGSSQTYINNDTKIIYVLKDEIEKIKFDIIQNETGLLNGDYTIIDSEFFKLKDLKNTVINTISFKGKK